MIILDANVLIGFLDGNDPHHAASIELVERRFADGFGSSVLTIAEALVHPTRAGRAEAATAALDAIGVRAIALGDGEAAALAQVRSDYRLRMPDAVVLRTALATKSPLATFDSSLAAAAEQAGVSVAN